MSEWRDISSAPRESKYILVWCPENRNHWIVNWMNGRWQTDGVRALYETPTHWMPLPSPPT